MPSLSCTLRQILCGAIGDAIGGRYEGCDYGSEIDFNFPWVISDDTQLTLATCESIGNTRSVSPEKIASNFLTWFNQKNTMISHLEITPFS